METNGALLQRVDAATGRPALDHYTKFTRFDWDQVLNGVDLRGRRADAFGNEFILPELIHISKIVNEQVFPENTYAEAFAMAPDMPAWYSKVYDYNDLTFSGTPVDETGEWSDPGVAVGISRAPNLSPIRPIPVNYSVNIAELAQFASIGQNAMATKAIQARRVVEQTFDLRAWYGNASLGIPGYASTTGISRDTVPTVGGHTTWNSKTGEEIYNDCRLIYQAIITASNGVWIPDTLAVPLKLKGVLTKPFGTAGATWINTQKYIEMNLDVKIIYSVRLNTLTKDGATNGTGSVAMYKNGSDVMRNLIVRGYYELGPQQVGRTMTVYADGVSGGLVIPQPTACALWDGVA